MNTPELLYACLLTKAPKTTILTESCQFYNLVLFLSSVAVFSLAAQRMSGSKLGK